MRYRIAMLLSIAAAVLGLQGIVAPVQAATCTSTYVNIAHTFVQEGADDDAAGNFVWKYCKGPDVNDYILLTTLGGNYNLGGNPNCGAGPSFNGLKVTFVLDSQEDSNITVPCQEDGTNGRTVDIANRRWNAPTYCSYAPPGECKVAVSYRMRLTLMYDYGIADDVWTSAYRTLG